MKTGPVACAVNPMPADRQRSYGKIYFVLNLNYADIDSKFKKIDGDLIHEPFRDKEYLI